jgi:hypothetical protein
MISNLVIVSSKCSPKTVSQIFTGVCGVASLPPSNFGFPQRKKKEAKKKERERPVESAVAVEIR